MKKLILIFLLCLTSMLGFSQDFSLMAETLRRRQLQYDNGYKSITEDYSYLMKLELINKQNIPILEIYKKNVKKNFQNVSNVDFSLPVNVERALNVINQYLTIKSIKDENELLNKIQLEINTLKFKNPDGYTSTTRFKEIIDFLKQLEICNKDDIRNLGWKNGYI